MSLNGLIVIDKPADWTSHDVVRKVKRLLKARKVGHTGTLDPAATGVLVLCLNEATRQAASITDHRKIYEASISLGTATDTGDKDGIVTETAAVPVLSEAQLREVLKRFEGEIEQVVPLYSAVKVQGKRLYQWARQGKGDEVVRPRRRVTIESVELRSWTQQSLEIQVTCSKGTFIRALAEDIGRAIGVPAHLGALRRVQQGPFSLDQAITLEQLERATADPQSATEAWLLPCP